MQRIDSVEYYNHNAKRFHDKRLKLKSAHDLAPLLQEFTAKSRVLDWGCGSGIDLIYIESAGHEAVGLECAPQMAELAKQIFPKARLIEKNGLFYTPEKNEWDAIWMNESINHFPSEQAQRILATCFQGIKPHGLLGMIVREGNGFFEDREDDQTGPSRTLYLYEEKSLCSMIEQTGFEILKLGRREDQPGLLMLIARRLGT